MFKSVFWSGSAGIKLACGVAVWQQSFEALVAIEQNETHAQFRRTVEDAMRPGQPERIEFEYKRHRRDCQRYTWQKGPTRDSQVRRDPARIFIRPKPPCLLRLHHICSGRVSQPCLSSLPRPGRCPVHYEISASSTNLQFGYSLDGPGPASRRTSKQHRNLGLGQLRLTSPAGSLWHLSSGISLSPRPTTSLLNSPIFRLRLQRYLNLFSMLSFGLIGIGMIGRRRRRKAKIQLA